MKKVVLQLVEHDMNKWKYPRNHLWWKLIVKILFLEEVPNWQVYDTAMECIGYMGYTVPYSSSSSIISKAQSNSIHKSKSKQLAQLPWEVKKQSRSSQFFFKKGNEHMEAGKQLY